MNEISTMNARMPTQKVKLVSSQSSKPPAICKWKRNERKRKCVVGNKCVGEMNKSFAFVPFASKRVVHNGTESLVVTMCE